MRAAVLLVLVLVGLDSSAEAAATPFKLGDQGGVVLPVTLNGRGPFKMLLDTGSTHSAVSNAVALAIEAPPRGQNGHRFGCRQPRCVVVRIDLLECGALVARGLLASVVTLDQASEAAGIQGVIGQDTLAGLRYTIDFRRRQLLWWPEGGAVARGTSFALEDSHGRFLISLPQRRAVLRLVPDSGAATLLLFDPPQALAAEAPPHYGMLTTLSGRNVRLARMRGLHVGPGMLQNVAAVVVGRSALGPGTGRRAAAAPSV